MGERIARLLPLLRLVQQGRVFGEVETRSKFRTGDDGVAVRCTPQVDDLFAHRPPLACKGDEAGAGRYLVALTGAGRIALLNDPDGSLS